MGSRTQSALAAISTAAGVLLVFAPAVAGLRTLSHRDTDRLYAPVRTLVVEALRDGRLPLWNPYEGTGKPLFAEGIHSVLHPVSLLGAVIAPSSIDFLLLAYLVAAALGAFLLARALGASPTAAAGAGLAYALSGFTVSMTGNVVFLAGAATVPWLAAAARSAGGGSRWGPVATALATACAFFSGDAQATLVGLAIGALLAGDADGWRGAGRALTGMGAGALLAGVQLATTAAVLPLSFRAGELDAAELTQWALPPGRLLEWAVPGLFRGPPAVIPRGASGASLDAVFSESVYLGAPLLLAAGLALHRRAQPAARRGGVLLAIAVIVLLWLALGHRAGGQQLLGWVPVWSRFRYSEKLMGAIALCASALAALGIDAFGEGHLAPAWRRAVAGLAAVTAAALVALRLAPDPTSRLALRVLGDAGPFYRATLAAGLPHVLVAMVALLAADRLRGARARAVALAVLVALAPAAAVRFGAPLGSPEARSAVAPLPLGSEAPTARLAHPAEKAYRSWEAGDFVEVTARHWSRLLYPSVNVAHRVDTIDEYGPLNPSRLLALGRSTGDAWARLYRRFGLTHVVIPIPRQEAYAGVVAAALEGARLVERDEGMGVEVWAVPHRPWAFFADRAVAASGPEEALQALLPLMVPGDDVTVVVEAAEAPPAAPGRVVRVGRVTERVVVEAEAGEPALLVVQDAWWPGWRATIDGAPAELLAADALVRAVRWPPGRHRLELSYDPPELRLGIALSATGAVLVAVLVALAVRRARRVD